MGLHVDINLHSYLVNQENQYPHLSRCTQQLKNTPNSSLNYGF